VMRLFFIFHCFTFFIISHTSRQKDLYLYFCHIDWSRKSRPNVTQNIQFKNVFYFVSV
jgi:hypothetical protein